MKKRKLGIVLIFIALCIGIFFMINAFSGKEEKVINRKDDGITSRETVPPPTVNLIVTPTPTKESAPDPAVDESKEPLRIEINPAILKHMGVTTEEFAGQIRIYANSCGWSSAEEVNDLDEMFVNYAEKTITVPCCFSMGRKTEKFDCIYHYEKKKYRFVPW